MVNSVDVPKPHKESLSKTEASDSKRLCPALSKELLHPIYIDDHVVTNQRESDHRYQLGREGMERKIQVGPEQRARPEDKSLISKVRRYFIHFFILEK